MEKQEDISRDWAQLPIDLLIHIAKRLKCVEQMFAFSAVCSSWRAVSRTVKPNWTPAIPCLVFPLSTENDPSCVWSVFDPCTNKHGFFELPEPLPRYYQDCGDGWIFTYSTNLDVQLFNPLTKAQISFPSMETLPLLGAVESHYHNRSMKELARIDVIQRASVVKISPNGDFLVFLVYDLGCVAFAKPGDDAWTFRVLKGSHTCVEDVIVFKGQILILFADGKLVNSSLDLFLTEGENLVFQEYVAGDARGNMSIYVENSLESLHLVESSGSILVVLRYTRNFMGDDELEGINELEGITEDFGTFWFEVFKFDSEANKLVNDLEDVSLFVGNHSVMSVSASNAINCKPNCIYFIDDKAYHPTMLDDKAYHPTMLEWRSIGIFNLQSGEIEELCPRDRERYILSTRQYLFWLMPKFV